MKPGIHLALAITLLVHTVICNASDNGSESPPVATPVTQNGVAYITGGVGQDEAEAIRAVSRQYSLRITFVIKSGQYLSDVAVEIVGASGTPDLNIRTQGPFLFVSLPSGIYQVSAHAGRASETRVISIAQTKDLSVQFNIPIAEAPER
jgi:hypothetical protein